MVGDLATSRRRGGGAPAQVEVIDPGFQATSLMAMVALATLITLGAVVFWQLRPVDSGAEISGAGPILAIAEGRLAAIEDPLSEGVARRLMGMSLYELGDPRWRHFIREADRLGRDDQVRSTYDNGTSYLAGLSHPFLGLGSRAGPGLGLSERMLVWVAEKREECVGRDCSALELMRGMLQLSELMAMEYYGDRFEAVRRLAAMRHPDVKVYALFFLAERNFQAGRMEDTRARLEELEPLLARSTDVELHIGNLRNLAELYWRMGDQPNSLRMAREMRDAARRASNRVLYFETQADLVVLLAETGRMEEADRFLAETRVGLGRARLDPTVRAQAEQKLLAAEAFIAWAREGTPGLNRVMAQVTDPNTAMDMLAQMLTAMLRFDLRRDERLVSPPASAG
jgi:hypothetical protein